MIVGCWTFLVYPAGAPEVDEFDLATGGVVQHVLVLYVAVVHPRVE